MATTKKKRRLGTTADYKDFVHTGPETLSGRYLRLFWQPVYRSKDLPRAHAKPIRIMGEDFTLYRGEGGTPHVVAFRCAHRGTQLSAGWVEGDFIRCVYHGWKYDGSGQCVEQPAEEKPFAQKIRIRNCPTEEYLGLIFAYFGPGEPPPLPHYPHFEIEGILDTLPVLSWPCNFFQHLENLGDAAHLPFTHRESYFTADARSGVPMDICREETSWGLVTRASFPTGATQIYNFGMPNIHDIRIPAPDREIPWDDRIAWTVPVNDDSCTTFRVRLLPITGATASRYLERQQGHSDSTNGPSSEELGDSVLAGKIRFQDLRQRAKSAITYVNAQDYVAQVGQGRIADRSNEHLGRSDLGVILFRKIWERELRTLKGNRPLKKWTYCVGEVAARGVSISSPA
jgi:5,5'-dehydrodivanillate O-demethylase